MEAATATADGPRAPTPQPEPGSDMEARLTSVGRAVAGAGGDATLLDVFDALDADCDEHLDKLEYEVYLRGMGFWGKGDYGEEKWPDKWLEECSDLGCAPEAGVTRAGFVDKLYGEYRDGKASGDIAKLMWSTDELRADPQVIQAAKAQLLARLVEEELMSLTKRQLRERAASVGVSRAEIQRAADGATPKRDVSASICACAPSALMVYPCLYRWSG